MGRGGNSVALFPESPPRAGRAKADQALNEVDGEDVITHEVEAEEAVRGK
jgi:hypothetical protein